MASEKEELALGRVSSGSVREATGRGWEDWLEALDAAGAADWDHKQTVGWPTPSTLQLTLSESGTGKTAIHAHLEKLPDADTREVMRKHWREALERIATAAP